MANLNNKIVLRRPNRTAMQCQPMDSCESSDTTTFVYTMYSDSNELISYFALFLHPERRDTIVGRLLGRQGYERLPGAVTQRP